MEEKGHAHQNHAASAAFCTHMLVLLSCFFTYLLAETGYRIYRYQRLYYHYYALHDGTKTGRNDPYLGYPPNVQSDEPAQEGREPRRFHTNQYGHISYKEYPETKPDGEFRIVTIGDSFTAGVMNSVQWPDVLEARLGQNAVWQKKTGKSLLVINLGIDGISAEQFMEVFEREGKRFDADLVLVSFILDDLPRRPYIRGQTQNHEDIARFVRENILATCPWYAVYPELLANTAVGRRLGLRPKLDPQCCRVIMTRST